MSKLIKIEEMMPGMTLAVPVKNKYGQIMLAVDTVVEEKHRKILKMWGITGIYIKEENNQETENGNDERKLSDAKEALSKRITWIPQNPIEEEFYSMALQITMEKIY